MATSQEKKPRLKLFSGATVEDAAQSFNDFVLDQINSGYLMTVLSQSFAFDGGNYVVSVIYTLSKT